MEKPKYQIGDRIPETDFIVRGIAPLRNGDYRYFLQIRKSDNTMVAVTEDLEINIFDGRRENWHHIPF
jgi:hypothetical protein